MAPKLGKAERPQRKVEGGGGETGQGEVLSRVKKKDN